MAKVSGIGGVSSWRPVAASLARPYRVTPAMVLLAALVPMYVFIPGMTAGRPLHAPALAIDRMLPLRPAWAFVYGTLYLFLIVLPVLVVRQQEQIRRTVWAYLLVWITAYVCFLAYPTVAPRPAKVMGEGFIVWGLRFLYAADPPHNCFPSLHVAHSFVSALTCYRVHRALGGAAVVSAALVALSTLFAKQHYVVDVVAGTLLAWVAYALFLRRYPRDGIPEAERRLAPAFALVAIGIVSLAVAVFWIDYQLKLELE